MSNNIIYIFSKKIGSEYKTKIIQMDKLQLLEEMVRFQEERSKLGHLTPEMIIQGKILFQALENSTETEELKLLTISYRKYLESN